MRIKKTVSTTVVAANAAKLRKHRTANWSRDVECCDYSLLEKSWFSRTGKRRRNSTLVDDLEADHQPLGRTEQALVEEIAVCLWKMQKINGLEQKEITMRSEASKAILRSVAANCEDKPLPLFVNDDGSRSPAELGWECRELIVQTGSTSSEQEQMHGGEDSTAKSGKVQIEARLNTSIDSILRYSAAIKRDLYRAIGTLRDIQRERRDRAE